LYVGSGSIALAATLLALFFPRGPAGNREIPIGTRAPAA
jgi:hypothetical protein